MEGLIVEEGGGGAVRRGGGGGGLGGRGDFCLACLIGARGFIGLVCGKTQRAGWAGARAGPPLGRATCFSGPAAFFAAGALAFLAAEAADDFFAVSVSFFAFAMNHAPMEGILVVIIGTATALP